MNPNQITDPNSGKPVPECEDNIKHSLHVWKNYVEKSGFDKLLVIAHSYGGNCLVAIQERFSATFYKQVKKIAITDGRGIAKDKLKKSELEFMQKNAINYRQSNKPLGT